MSETKFTPGPWQAMLHADKSGRYIESVARNPAFKCDFPLHCSIVTLSTYQEADAHLIATAPELYGMLESLACNSLLEMSDEKDEILLLLKQARGES